MRSWVVDSRRWTKPLLIAAAFALGLAIVATTWATGSREDHIYAAHYENVLGTSFEMKTLAATEEESGKAEATALTEIDREAKILSSWDPKSEFSKWFQTEGQPVHVSHELFEVLSLFDEWRARTNGALDPSAEAITRVWQKAAAEKRMPTRAELETAVASVREKHWKLDDMDQTATHTSETPLAMNSFVKSYIIGHAADAALRVRGVRGVVVNIGGDLVVRGDWDENVDIADPREDAENAPPIARLSIRDKAIATSGDYRRGVEINGRHFSHIVDPRTAEPAERVISSTVIAAAPATAGALATAFSVMTPEESKQLAASVPGVEYMLIEDDGTIDQSDGWSALEISNDRQITTQSKSKPKLELVSSVTKPAAWNPNYELTIGFQLPALNEFRARRPYVAVWIIDENYHPVRTLMVWYGKYQYVHELSEWFGTVFAGNSNGAIPLLNSVSSATRPAGSYTVRWDGKDDAGKLVNAGKYIVYIEAAREHGTHQLIRQDIILNGSAQRINLRGNMEIASAYLDYHEISQ